MTTVRDYHAHEERARHERALSDQEVNRTGLRFASAYRPPTVAPDDAAVHDLQTYVARSVSLPVLFLNLQAIEIATYLLGAVRWARAVTTPSLLLDHARPPKPILWLGDMFGFVVEAHQCTALFLKPSDFLSHDRHVNERPVGWTGWNGDRPAMPVSDVVYLNGIETKNARQMVRRIVGAWVNLGRQHRLPWDATLTEEAR